jgi:hypothetical protein
MNINQRRIKGTNLDVGRYGPRLQLGQPRLRQRVAVRQGRQAQLARCTGRV